MTEPPSTVCADGANDSDGIMTEARALLTADIPGVVGVDKRAGDLSIDLGRRPRSTLGATRILRKVSDLRSSDEQGHRIFADGFRAVQAW